jgi:hypothetical protein
MSSDEELDLTGQILILALGLGLASPLFVRLFQNLSLYQGFLLVIGWWQACITGYLSYKIYVLTRAESKVPDLKIDSEMKSAETAEDCTVPDIKFFKFKITNTSHGKAKITDIQVEHYPPVDQTNLVDDCLVEEIGAAIDSYQFELPVVLNHQDDFDFRVMIYGVNHVDFIGIHIEEQTLGNVNEYRDMNNEPILYFEDDETVPDFV